MLIVDVIFLFSTLLMILFGWMERGGFAVPILFFLLLATSFIPLGLLVFHLYMIFSNQTTWEWISRDRIYYLSDIDEEILPFDRGCYRNGVEFFFKMKRDGYSWRAPDECYREDYEPPQNCCNNKHYSCF